MTQTELTRMKTWIEQHVEDYLVYTPVGTLMTNADFANDFYNHFKNEIQS